MVMKGVETVIQEDGSVKKTSGVSEFMVLGGDGIGRGYYIGTLYRYSDEECAKEGIPPGFIEPNSRETDYFRTRKEAEEALAVYKKTGVLPKERF